MTPTRQRILVIGLIILGVLAVGFFGMRAFHAFRRFEGHRPPSFSDFDNIPVETDVELIRDWMTIGSISHSYRLPPKLLYEGLQIRPNGNERKSLKQLNDEFFPDQPDHVLNTVKDIVRANLPPSAPNPSPAPTAPAAPQP